MIHGWVASFVMVLLYAEGGLLACVGGVIGGVGMATHLERRAVRQRHQDIALSRDRSDRV